MRKITVISVKLISGSLTFSDTKYGKRKRVSRREIFLQKMDALIPRAELTAVIQPYYYAGKRGRPHKLVRPDDRFVNEDAGYLGIEKRGEIWESEHLSGVQWRINRRKGRERKWEKELYKKAGGHLEYIGQPRWDERIEYLKSKVRSKVEHNFYIIKHLFGYRKARYRGIEKNGARLYICCLPWRTYCGEAGGSTRSGRCLRPHKGAGEIRPRARPMGNRV